MQVFCKLWLANCAYNIRVEHPYIVTASLFWLILDAVYLTKSAELLGIFTNYVKVK